MSSVFIPPPSPPPPQSLLESVTILPMPADTKETSISMQRVENWKGVLLLLALIQILRLRGSVHAYRRMSIAPNASTVNPHFWYRQPSPTLPSWYTHSSTNYRSHKVFSLRYLSYSDVRCNDGTKAGQCAVAYFWFTDYASSTFAVY
ncbi:hypothetical protein ACTXT7_005099 [Hymenolepis weldensis]